MFYKIWQCTWGLLQTLAGFILFLKHRRDPHFWYHGALITLWEPRSSISLGLFVFVAAHPSFIQKYKGQIPEEELHNRLLVHEYGHTIQSLLLGPLYLVLVGLPSLLWAKLGGRKRRAQQIPYGAFFTERWANRWGEKVTGRASIGDMIL